MFIKVLRLRRSHVLQISHSVDIQLNRRRICAIRENSLKPYRKDQRLTDDDRVSHFELKFLPL